MANEKKRSEKGENSLIGEFKKVIRIINIQCDYYYYKFIALLFVAILTIFVGSNDCKSVIISTLTFIGLLFIDQAITKNFSRDYEFGKVGQFCNLFKFFLLVLVFIVLCLAFCINILEVKIGVIHCKVGMFILSFISSFSAIVEAVHNIPEQSLTKEQERVEKLYTEGGEE